MQSIDLSSAIANSTSPKYDGAYLGGNRAADYQLPIGNFVPQLFSMVGVYPRPDSETGSYAGTVNAPHRWAYYDGATPVRYEADVKVFGGSPPHIYTLTSAPAGATIENIFGDPKRHGIVKWTPSQAYTTSSPANFTVRVTGQDGVFIDMSWTVATATTSKFIFIAPNGNDSTGNGAIGTPYKTLAKVFGATTTTTTFPNKIVYMRAGAYATAPHSDSFLYGGETIPCRVRLSGAYQPISYMSFPDEIVSIDFTASEIIHDSIDGVIAGSSGNPLRMIGSTTNANETHNIWPSSTSLRTNYRFIDFDGFIPRVNGGYTNSVPIFLAGSNSNPTRQYITCHNIQEINRTQWSANDGLLFICYGVKYFVNEYCKASRGSGGGVDLKDTCYQTSTRYMEIVTSGTDFSISFACQSGSADQEVCFSKLKGAVWFNLQANATAGKIFEYRNSIWNIENSYPEAVRAWDASDKNYKSINSVVCSNGSPAVNTLITNTGTECQVLNSNPNLPVNLSTMNLVNNGVAYRTNYLGKRGWEISF